MYYHGDFEEDHLPHNQEKTGTNTSVISDKKYFPSIDTDFDDWAIFIFYVLGWMPCVWQINNFASVFLFR